MSRRRGSVPVLVMAAFFASGSAALVYQVVWQRILALHSGVGIYSIAMIVAAFMVGLGLGSHLGGVLSSRRSPAGALRVFALLELGIAAFGAASPWLYYDWLFARGAWLYTPFWRAGLLHFLGLAAPTVLMGMSLPFLVRAFVSSAATASRTVGILYGINLLGGATGALLAPWVLIRTFGMRGALLAAAGTNLAAALCALATRTAAGEEGASTPPPSAPRPAGSEPAHPLAFWALLYALGGFCALSLEMLWFRIMDVALKATSFTFGTVLAIYLLGMALGTFAGAPTASRLRNPLRVFLMTQTALLAYAGAIVVLLARLPPGAPVYRRLVEYWAAPRPFNLGGDWQPGPLLLLYVLVPLVLYGPPTMLMGYSFTVLQRAVHDDPRTSGRKVGLLQAANIAGCVAGSLLVGLAFLTWWGTIGTLRAVLFCGLGFVLAGAWRDERRPALLGAGAFLVALAATLPPPQVFWLRLHATKPDGGWVAEDATGMAALIPSGPRWSLWVNGRTNSSLPFGGFHTLLGAVPAVVHPDPAEVAIVGLGSGDTAWAAGCRPGTRRVTVYEICAPQVTLLRRLAASPEGPPTLRAFLADPRVRLVVADGRNALALGSARYDLIEMDALFPSSPYSGNLYSLEFFRSCASRLKPGGIMCSWAPKPRVATTFRAAFPHVVELRGGQLLLGANDPLPLDVEAWSARARDVRVEAYLGANNLRKLLDVLGTAAPAEGPLDPQDLNRDLFPRDEFKAGPEAGRDP